jgi:hypothetical protein
MKIQDTVEKSLKSAAMKAKNGIAGVGWRMCICVQARHAVLSSGPLKAGEEAARGAEGGSGCSILSILIL